MSAEGASQGSAPGRARPPPRGARGVRAQIGAVRGASEAESEAAPARLAQALEHELRDGHVLHRDACIIRVRGWGGAP